MKNLSLSVKLNETISISVPSRGSRGFKLDVRIRIMGIVEVLESSMTISNQNPGSSNIVIYKIKAVGKGNTDLTFFETRSWDKDFPEQVVLEVKIKVE